MKFWIKAICLLLLLGSFGLSEAQTLKQVEVSGSAPYVDHVALMPGSADMDMMVKIAFDEPNNSLTVSLISYRKLFVFQSAVRYSQVVKWNRLRPDRLPYPVASNELARYTVTKSLKKSLGKAKKYVFKRWIEYDGLQPQPAEYNMVNDYIEQRFDILYKEAPVSFTLRDLLLMEGPTTTHKKTGYDLFFLTDLNRTYEVTIRRDPCFGKEEAIQLSASQLESIKASYAAFDQKFGSSSQFQTADSEKLFDKMKELLLQQFPRQEETNPCPTIQANIDQYNAYVDSIEQMQCKFRIMSDAGTLSIPLDLSADYILSAARKIDNHVNRWLLTSDKIERKDLENACLNLIDQIQPQIDQATDITSDQHEAIRIFHEAANYFRKTCGKE